MIKAQLLHGKHEIVVRSVDEKGNVNVVSLQEWNKHLKTPIVPPSTWRC